MGNVIQDFDLGTPSATMRWPKDAVVKTEVLKNAEGRFLARISVNGAEFFNLPGSYPTKNDAELTLQYYVAENKQDT